MFGCLIFCAVFFIGIALSLMGVQSADSFSAIFIVLLIVVVLGMMAMMGVFNKKDK